MTPRGPHAVNVMVQGWYREPFGEGGLSALGVVQELPAGFQSEKRLDYDVRTDEKPVYVAFAEYRFISSTATITPSTSASVWIIQKFTYDGSNRVTRIQVNRGAWDDRTTLF